MEVYVVDHEGRKIDRTYKALVSVLGGANQQSLTRHAVTKTGISKVMNIIIFQGRIERVT